MKKAIIALAVLAQCSAAAFAQSSVTMYGVVDLGVSVDRGGVTGTSTRLTSGMATQSRWGFRGTEELGGGLNALFVIEGGFSADKGSSTQNNTLFGRTTIVGLHGGFGTVTLGLQDTPYFTTLNVVVDPMRNGVGRSNNLMAHSGYRARNSVLYRSNDLSGFSGDLMYSAGEVAGDNSAGRALGGSFGYSRAALNVRLAHHHRNNDTALLKNTEDAKNTLLGANYNVGPAKAYFGYSIDKGPGSAALNNPRRWCASDGMGTALQPVAIVSNSPTRPPMMTADRTPKLAVMRSARSPIHSVVANWPVSGCSSFQASGSRNNRSACWMAIKNNHQKIRIDR
jgi:predicted porin